MMVSRRRRTVATTVAKMNTKDRYALMSRWRYLEKKMDIIEKPGKKVSRTGRVDSGVGDDCAVVAFWGWRRDAILSPCSVISLLEYWAMMMMVWCCEKVVTESEKSDTPGSG